MRPDVWIMNGIPGAGKTTARELARRLGHGVHIEGDRLMEWILSGGVRPEEEPADEAERQIQLNVRNQCLLARSFHEAGFTPVLDYVVVHRARLAEYERQLAPLRLRMVVLAPGREVALERDRLRTEKTVAEQWAFLEGIIERELLGHGCWIDNRDLSPEEVVGMLLG